MKHMDEVLTAQRDEFEAADGTFLLLIRSDLKWDRATFTRLEQAMRATCAIYQQQEELPRWLAEGYYYVSHFVADWTSHPNFPRPDPEDYYTDCLERLSDLADWFFRGVHNYQEPHTWAEL
jgi:hypothetical protein